MVGIRYVKEPNSFLVKKPGASANSSGSRQLLLGARLHIDEESIEDGWTMASTVPDEKGKFSQGFVQLARLSERQQLKIFYLDVGQGDASLIEAEDAILIIDGGPNSGFYTELNKRLQSLQRAEKALARPAPKSMHINAVFVSHFDLDHYRGLTKVLASKKFTFGTLYHNGLPRYGEAAQKDLNLGSVTQHTDGTHSISTDLRDIESARALLDSGSLLTEKGKDNVFAKFLRAAVQAHEEGRLGNMHRLERRKSDGAHPLIKDTGEDIRLELLGPLTTTANGPIRLRAFPDPHSVSESNPHPKPSESHTVNGNSLVLRLVYGDTSFLFGGDLNQPAQVCLLKRYGDAEVFKADVNKACHHGSPDFHLPYLESVRPEATVFSSGDNGSYDHPFPDAMGAAAKHSRGKFPLVFSTELARETGKSKIKLGHINARSNGKTIVMAQKKEKPTLKQTWYSFPLPYAGPFGDSH